MLDQPRVILRIARGKTGHPAKRRVPGCAARKARHPAPKGANAGVMAVVAANNASLIVLPKNCLGTQGPNGRPSQRIERAIGRVERARADIHQRSGAITSLARQREFLLLCVVSRRKRQRPGNSLVLLRCLRGVGIRGSCDKPRRPWHYSSGRRRRCTRGNSSCGHRAAGGGPRRVHAAAAGRHRHGIQTYRARRRRKTRA